MAGRNGRDSQLRGDRYQLPPIELGGFRRAGNAVRQEAVAKAEWNDEVRLPLLGNAAEGRNVEMVIVVVTFKHHVERRKLLQQEPRRTMAAGAHARERAGAV